MKASSRQREPPRSPHDTDCIPYNSDGVNNRNRNYNRITTADFFTTATALRFLVQLTTANGTALRFLIPLTIVLRLCEHFI